jgi:ribosomal protein S18 acetylase RimI-like enzyme
MPDARNHIDAIKLTALNDTEFKALGMLRVSARQEFLGGSFLESLDAWHQGPAAHVLGLCFLFRNEPIGLTLFKSPPKSPSWVTANGASVHGLKIARPWHGRGWGHIAFRLAVARLMKEWPTTKSLVLAVDADNTPALAVYRAFGMTDCGPVFEGRHGPEHRLGYSL